MLSLGTTPLANSLLGEEDLATAEPRYPLEVVFCAECSLVQLTVSVPPADLFVDYPYFSSVSASLMRHFGASAEYLRVARGLGAGSTVVEAASNDGYYGYGYRRCGWVRQFDAYGNYMGRVRTCNY